MVGRYPEFDISNAGTENLPYVSRFLADAEGLT